LAVFGKSRGWEECDPGDSNLQPDHLSVH
jgi:hypothetical protein